MRINEIIIESQIDEGPIGNAIGAVGRGVGKAVGGVARGAGAVAGGVAGIGRAFKKGFQSGKATVAGDPDPNAAAAGSSGAAAEPAASGPVGQIKAMIDKLSQPDKDSLTDLLQKEPSAAKPAAPAAEPASSAPATDKPAAGPGSATAGTTASGQPKTEPDLNAPAAAPAAKKPDAATQAKIDAAPQGYDPETGKPNAAPAATPAATAEPAATATAAAPATTKAAPAGKTAAPANKAASDTFEKAKGDIRKVQGGTKPLPDQMAAGVQADIAKMAKGDKESGVAAAQKIMGFAQRGMDVAALQQAWSANAKAGERFLSQSVYRSITNMLREHGLIWSDLNLRVRIDESVGNGVFIRYARPVTESVTLFRIK